MVKIIERGPVASVVGRKVRCARCLSQLEVEAGDVLKETPYDDFRGEPYGKVQSITCPVCGADVQVVKGWGTLDG